MQPIRTISEIDLEFPVFTSELFLYQKISLKVKQLHKLGMNVNQISDSLKIDNKTIKKALKWNVKV